MGDIIPKRFFITGIPTAGKSYLAKKIANAIGGTPVLLDDFREGLRTEEAYKKWVDFYLDRDESNYLTDTSPDQMWSNLVTQSESLWPAFFKKIESYETAAGWVIFECVNILPHLAKRDLRFPGVVLIGSSYEDVLERNKRDPRWSSNIHLQELEAKMFFEIERPYYKAEAEKYGYPIFEKADDAFDFFMDLYKNNG
jgi:adenylate kinase